MTVVGELRWRQFGRHKAGQMILEWFANVVRANLRYFLLGG